MVTERGLDVLRAIVTDYVSSHEPVGSKSLVDRYGFGVSAATIRNDMALLEEEKLIAAPHTSSGRIPTDKGYRVFVDQLVDNRQISSIQRAAIEKFMNESEDFDDLLARTVRVLSQLTNQVAVVQYPTLGHSRVQHVEIVRISSRRLTVIVIADSGRVEQRLVETSAELSDEQVFTLRSKINAAISGTPLSEVDKHFAECAVEPSLQNELSRIRVAINEQIQATKQSRLVLTGTAHLAKTESDFSGSLYPILDAIEEQVVLLKLLSEMQASVDTVNISIGHEHTDTVFEQTSVMSAGYVTNGELAQIGLIGPTRMDYPANIAAVRAVSRYLTQLLDSPPGR